MGKINAANRVLAAARNNIRACFQAALNCDPDVGGRVTFTAHLVADGAVEHVCLGATGPIGQSIAMPCIADVLVKLHFSPPEQPASVPAGAGRATISGAFTFENSAAAPRSPVSPPARASGDGT